MKRFTETTKWDDPWFRSLSPTTKLLWQWLLDHCDIAGVIRPDLGLASFQIGQPVNEQNLTELGDRVQALEGGKFIIAKFVSFQFGELSPASQVHRSVVKTFQSHGLQPPNPKPVLCQPLTKTSPTLDQGLARGSPTPKDKDKDKDITKETIKELPEPINSSRVKAKWQAWMVERRSMKKPKSWATLFNEQVDWLCQFSEPEVFEILSASLRNGWQGLFEPKPVSVGNGNGKPMSPLDYRTIIQAKEAQATELYNRHCSESALSKIWDSQTNRDKFATLRREIKELNAKLGALGGSR